MPPMPPAARRRLPWRLAIPRWRRGTETGIGLLRLRRCVVLMAASIWLLPGPAQAEEDLTSRVQISRSGWVPNRTTDTVDSQVTVTNLSADTLLGPLKLVLEEASPVEVALYNSRGRQPSGADYMRLPLDDGTLPPGASTVGIVRLLTHGQPVAATRFSVQGQRLTAANTTQLQISVVYPPGLMGPREMPVGAGFTVSVDGVDRGRTDAAGQLRVTAPVGAQVVDAAQAPNHGGSDILPELAAGAVLAVKITVDESKEISADTQLQFDQVRQGLLDRGSAKVSLRFLKNERPVAMERISSVALVDKRWKRLDLMPLFSVQADGSLAAAPGAFFEALAGVRGRLQLEVSAEDADGAVHEETVAFHLADHRVRVQLVAPPSNPALPLGGVRLVATMLGTDVRFNAQADANGYVVLPDLPGGNLSLSGSTALDGLYYTGYGTAAINKHSLLRLTMLGPKDMLDNVSPIATQLLPGAAPTPRLDAERDAGRRRP